MKFSVCAEIEWPFEDGDANWRYCVKNAAFAHKEACEFIVHVGERREAAQDELPDFARHCIEDMKKHGCTPEFIAAYEGAARAGAVRVLFWT